MILTLTEDEAQLVAYILQYPVPTANPVTPEDWPWLETRLKVGSELARLRRCQARDEERKKAGMEVKAHEHTVSLDLTDRELQTLAIICPSTWHWGPGPDCGQSLFLKLTEALIPSIPEAFEEGGEHAEGEDSSQDRASGKA